jgi:hypothetical protein
LAQGILAPQIAPTPNLWTTIFRAFLKGTLNKSRHPNIASLQTVIPARFKKLRGVELKRACQCFSLRLEEIIKAEGGYIK